VQKQAWYYEEYHRFRRLSQELLEVNEQIYRLQPILKEESAGEEKTAEAIRQEVAPELEHLLQVIFQAQRRIGRLDLEDIEMAARSAPIVELYDVRQHLWEAARKLYPNDEREQKPG
jgi:hypothetical protein